MSRSETSPRRPRPGSKRTETSKPTAGERVSRVVRAGRREGPRSDLLPPETGRVSAITREAGRQIADAALTSEHPVVRRAARRTRDAHAAVRSTMKPVVDRMAGFKKATKEVLAEITPESVTTRWNQTREQIWRNSEPGAVPPGAVRIVNKIIGDYLTANMNARIEHNLLAIDTSVLQHLSAVEEARKAVMQRPITPDYFSGTRRSGRYTRSSGRYQDLWRSNPVSADARVRSMSNLFGAAEIRQRREDGDRTLAGSLRDLAASRAIRKNERRAAEFYYAQDVRRLRRELPSANRARQREIYWQLHSMENQWRQDRQDYWKSFSSRRERRRVERAEKERAV